MTDSPVRIFQLASKFSSPISIASLVIAALYVLYRIVLEKSDLELLREGEVFIIVDKVITYLFVLALVGLVLGVVAHVATRVGGRKRRKVARKPARTSSNDPYEYLKWESVWDIKDPAGKKAEYTKKAAIRFLQPNVGIITDRVWGQGETMHDYRCTLGVPSDVFNYGNSKKVVISLRENRKKGSVASLTISRTILQGFTRSEEWIEEEPVYPVKRYALKVIFPKGRPCRRAVFTRLRANVTEEIASEDFSQTADGRQELLVSFRNLGRERILLRWWW